MISIFKFKKIVAVFFAIVFVGIILPVGASVSARGNLKTDANKEPYYKSFTGTVKHISIFPGNRGFAVHRQHVWLEDEAGSPVVFVISRDTIFADDMGITTGTVITGFYKAHGFAPAIYPPQYAADIIAVNTDSRSVKVDLFDENLISSDNNLKLNISADTQIVMPDGKAFRGELANKKLVVIYNISTRSIPAQTTPARIIVLDVSDKGKTDKKQRNRVRVKTRI